MRLTYSEDYNDKAREVQRDNFVNALCDKALSACVYHRDQDIGDQMHNCSIDERKVDANQFQVIITVDYCRDS